MQNWQPKSTRQFNTERVFLSNELFCLLQVYALKEIENMAMVDALCYV